MNTTSDLDECTLKSDDCQQICVDTLGSFFCQCHTGFHLANDQRTCVQGKHRCHLTTNSILLAKINRIMTEFHREQLYTWRNRSNDWIKFFAVMQQQSIPCYDNTVLILNTYHLIDLFKY